jgi:hypothetical protein
MTFARVKNLMVGAAMAGAVIAAGQGALADDGGHHGWARYKITIQNATLGQGIAPSLLVVHYPGFSLFEIGGTATPGLEALAESGNSQARADELAGADGVAAVYVTEGGPTPPGRAVTAEIRAPRNAKFLSAAAMLGITNDAFYAVRGVRLPVVGTIKVEADAYDAGTEVNTETKEDVAGLMGTGSVDENGFIHVHAGVHGVGGSDGLKPEVHDWRNPVVVLTITRLRG